MEDFVYIILVIAWLVISLMKRKPKNEAPAKPRPASRPETASEPKPVNIEEMFQEFFGGKTEKQPEPELVRDQTAIERSYEQQEQKYSSFDDDYLEMPEPVFEEFTGEEAVAEEYKFVTEIREQTIDDLIRANAAEEARMRAAGELAEENAERHDLPEFDIRSAVIFSEILNRKYS
jgi:hypothetical protein